MMRFRSLDSLRFIAAACVAIFHINIDLHLHAEAIAGAIENFGVFVDFFFILSGLVIAVNYANRVHDWSGYGRFMQKRLARIYPLHFVVLFVFAGAGIIGERLHVPMNYPDNFRLDALPANLLLVQAWGLVDHGSFNAASWSISAEMFVYLLFPLMGLLVARLHLVANLMIFAVFVALMDVTRRALHLAPWTSATFDFGMLRAVPTFFLGVLIARHLPWLRLRFRPSWWSVYALLLLALATMHFGLPTEVTIIVFAVIIIAAACAEARDDKTFLLSRTCVTLGDASYAIYLTHGIVLMGAVFAVKHTVGVGTVGAAFAGLVVFCLTLIVSIVTYKWFEDPMRRYLGQLGFGHKRQTAVQSASGRLKVDAPL